MGEGARGQVEGMERKSARENKKRKAMSGRGRGAGAAVTDRDVEIVGWLGRHGLATAEQVMRRFRMQRSKTYQRLGVLVEFGLVRVEPGVRTSRIYLATPKGLRAADLDLPRARVAPATAAHALAVVDAAIPLESTSMRLVLTEREIRRLDRRDDLRPFGLGGRSAHGMWPDLVILDRIDSARHAIEVELTLKKRDRIEEKLITYAISSYSTVTYRCATRAIARAVAEAGARAGLAGRLVIESIGDTVEPEDESERLLAALRVASDRAAEAEARMCSMSDSLDRERRAAHALAEEITQYLAVDRGQRKATRQRWQQLMFGRSTGPR